MNPIDLVFTSLSQMTNGLIVDMQTLVVFILGFEFLLFGFEYVSDFITNSFARNGASITLSDAESNVRSAYKDMAYHRGIAWTPEYDKKLDLRLSEIRAINAERRYSRAEDDLFELGGSSFDSKDQPASDKRDLVASSHYDDWF